MKKFSELMEKSGDTAVFTFGRLNPPTTGHGKLIDAMSKQQSKNAGSKMHVFVSHSQDAKKNPLDYKRKVAYIRKMFPKYAKNITTDKARTIFEVAVSLYNRGYKSIIMVVGSDRVAEFERLLNEYNGVESRHGYYGFDNIEVVSAGERDPDAEGLEGMSASKMRAAAMDGDLDSFKQGVPDGFKDVEKLYRDVRKSMGIREERMMGELDFYEEMRDDYLTGKIWNVGEIVEAKGMIGEIVRKGTNYISFVTEDNKVHKAWLHEIKLDEMTWFMKVKAKVDQMTHPKSYEEMIKMYIDKFKRKSGKQIRDGGQIKFGRPSSIAAEVAREFNVPARNFQQYINKLVDKGVLPKELKAEYQTEDNQNFRNLISQIEKLDEVKQDKEIKDREGTQPAKYYAKDTEGDEMSKSTKQSRARHFAKKKSGPAPGDATAKTKLSVHTKKYKQMFGEILDKNADIGDYVKDFKKSDAPQFKGKSDKKKHKMAVAAYLSRNETLVDKVDEMLTENGHTDVASMKNKVAIAYKALEKMQSELSKLGNEDDLPTWWTNKVATAVSRIDDMSDYLDTQVDEAYQIDEKIKGLINKADKSGMPYGILKKVYDRGMAAWKTGHRPGTTPQQWAFARVNSFITKSSGTWGKADADLAKQVRGESIEEDSCWDTHKQVGMKKKGDKMVPNCVPKNEEYEAELNEWSELTEKAEYDGRPVDLNNPTEGDRKKYKVYVKNDKGNVVKVEFGDPNMEIKRDDPGRLKAFRARHQCDTNPGPKWKAKYWSCKFWEKGKTVTDLMKG
jgi:hypothetical protein